MRSPVATSNGCAPVFASYSAMTRFTSFMSAVAGSYSRIVVSPWDENVRTLAFISGLLRDFIWLPWERSWRGWSLNAIMHRCGKMSRRHFHGAKAENSLLLVLGDWRRTQTGIWISFLQQPLQRATGIATTLVRSLGATAMPSRKATTFPELAATRSPGTMMPTRFSGSAAETVM